jgi:hypothetical protein
MLDGHLPRMLKLVLLAEWLRRLISAPGSRLSTGSSSQIIGLNYILFRLGFEFDRAT